MKRIILVELLLLVFVSLRITIVKDKPEPIKLTMIGTSEVKEKPKPVVRTTNYKLTHYGTDCSACSGITASGVDVRGSIYYNDNQYGTVRIVAMSKTIPMYSIIKIHNYFGNDITAIVLDRGVSNGIIDLLVENEKVANKYGILKGVEIEVLRYGK